MRILTSLNKDQMRLGYLNCLVLVAGRQLDSHSGLLRRFQEFILRKITPDDPEYQMHMLLIGQKHDHKTESIYFLHELWLQHNVVADATGTIAPKSCHQILKMGRNMGLIGPTYALTELGVLLRGLLLSMSQDFLDGRPDPNPFHLWKRPSLALTLLYSLLNADVVLPFLVELYAEEHNASKHQSVSRRETTNQQATVVGKRSDDFQRSSKAKVREHQVMYLIPALDRLIDSLSKDLPIDHTLLLQEIRKFRLRVENYERLKNHFYPRRQHLIDLGLLKRVEGSTKGSTRGEHLFTPTLATERASRVWRDLRETPLRQQSLIERNFFRWSAEVYGFSHQIAENDLKQLDYFARGFQLVRREIGFTPGRTVALAGCLIAIEEGVVIEVDEMFEMMSDMAKSRYRPYLHYSGGSRLDREFLIRVDVEPLREQLRRAGVKTNVQGHN